MISIVDDIGKVVQFLRSGSYSAYDFNDNNGSPYYMYGHRLEISNQLSELSQRPKGQLKKYPLIALNTMSITPNIRGNVWDFNLNIVIGINVDLNKSSEQREAEIFKPILLPLYDAFKDAFSDSPLGFMWQDLDFPPHTPMIKYFWGTEDKEGAMKNIFNETMCAIEIVNLKFSKEDNGCSTRRLHSSQFDVNYN